MFMMAIVSRTPGDIVVFAGFMQDENVSCHDPGNVSFERAVAYFGTSQLERATRFQMPQLDDRATRANKQLLYMCQHRGFHSVSNQR